MHHVERNHEDVPETVVSCPGKHLMLVVLGGKLGDTNMPDFSFRLLLDQGWDKCVSGMSVGRYGNAMKLEHVNIVSTQEPERTLQTLHHLRRSTPLAISSHRRLSRNDDRLPRDKLQRLADNRFGAVDRSSIDEIDAHIDGFAHQEHGFVLALASRQSKAAEAATTETRNADLQIGFSQSGVFHRSPLLGEFATTSRYQLHIRRQELRSADARFILSGLHQRLVSVKRPVKIVFQSLPVR